jgi:hypothetical protein
VAHAQCNNWKKMNLKDKILASTGRKVTSLTIPQWGLDVCVCSWTPKEFDDWQQWLKTENPSMDILARTAILSLCNEDGTKMFDESHIPALMEKDFCALQLIVDAALRLNNLKTDTFQSK